MHKKGTINLPADEIPMLRDFDRRMRTIDGIFYTHDKDFLIDLMTRLIYMNEEDYLF